MAIADSAATVQFAALSLAFIALVFAFSISDFSVYAVAAHSHSAKPMLYKIAGTWGNHEGSMVLWVLILAAFGCAVALFGQNLPIELRTRVLSVQGMIGFALLLFIEFTSNPFSRLDPAPLDGNDLNPLLQDPALAFHPPFLYVGYVGLSVPFAFAVAALWMGKVTPSWARWVRPWTLVAWIALTIGIAMGSWWAYYELGWGGWWFWDPVENASFMPWLMATALLHSAAVMEKRDVLKTWTILIAIIAFGLSLVGTFLVRSGVLTSVHAFANDPERGVFILAILAVAIGGALSLFSWRAGTINPTGMFAPVSRESALLYNNVLISTAAFAVFIGTLFPLFIETLGGEKLSVGPSYFDFTFTIIMFPLLLVVPLGAVLAWKRGNLQTAWNKLSVAAAVSLVVFVLIWALSDVNALSAAVGLALATWLVLGSLSELAARARLLQQPVTGFPGRVWRLKRQVLGMILAHMGVGIMVAGIAGIGAWRQEAIETLHVGDTAAIGNYQVVFEEIGPAKGPNYSAFRAEFGLFKDDQRLKTLISERRLYDVQRTTTTEVAIYTNWISDVYVALGDRRQTPENNEAWTVRLYANPLVPWIWFGAAVMALGGGVSLSDRTVRIGAPAGRRPQPVTAS